MPSSSSTPPRTFTLASRASQLAQIQTFIVRDALMGAHPAAPLATSFMRTAGDKNQAQALYLLGGKALWTGELEAALALKEVDMLVHSFKDVPTVLPAGCVIGAILQREDPVDCLVVREGKAWKSLEELPDGSVVGTSSVRRVAQLRRKFPKLAFLDVVCAPPCPHIVDACLILLHSAGTCASLPLRPVMQLTTSQEHPPRKARCARRPVRRTHSRQGGARPSRIRRSGHR